jgi:hypothetical protein
VDIISLSITPNRRPPGIATFFNPIDMALLSAVQAGIFVVQAAGNTGPAPKSMSSFSPWIFTVGASSHDRSYSNLLVLGNGASIPGVGLARKFSLHVLLCRKTLNVCPFFCSPVVSFPVLFICECSCLSYSVFDDKVMKYT